jgi:predicted Rossmann fold flavoprotein
VRAPGNGTTYDVAIVGAGAAGLMCAIEAGRRGRRVLVIEHADRAGKKILISGGGRCNFTNLNVTPDSFLSSNPHFCVSALARYTPPDFIAMVERHGIAYHEKEAGQLFCDASSRLIVEMLLEECRAAGVRVVLSTAVEAVELGEPGFLLGTNHGAIVAQSLVIATGGLSIPPMGATSFGYDLARRFGHRVLPTRAALVPLTLSRRQLEDYGDLSGVSLPVEVHCGRGQFRGAMLFTHRGLSGPAILQISSYWRAGEELEIDLLPDGATLDHLSAQQRLRPAAELRSVLAELLPRRLAQRLCELSFGSRPMRSYNQAELMEIAGRLHAWRVTPAGTEGYRTAEVTAGGVDTTELSSTTMESRLVPGLYFIGEVVDVTGHLGGFNFQWAWASGFAAGQAV